MFSIDISSNKKYYIILKDGKEFVKVSKCNPLATVMKHFEINVIKGGGNNEARFKGI